MHAALQSAHMLIRVKDSISTLTSVTLVWRSWHSFEWQLVTTGMESWR